VKLSSSSSIRISSSSKDSKGFLKVAYIPLDRFAQTVVLRYHDSFDMPSRQSEAISARGEAGG
jgi:hypothetical protein